MASAMELSNNVQVFGAGMQSTDSAIDFNDSNMDVDMDIDLGLDDMDNAEAEAEAMNIVWRYPIANTGATRD